MCTAVQRPHFHILSIFLLIFSFFPFFPTLACRPMLATVRANDPCLVCTRAANPLPVASKVLRPSPVASDGRSVTSPTRIVNEKQRKEKERKGKV